MQSRIIVFFTIFLFLGGSCLYGWNPASLLLLRVAEDVLIEGSIRLGKHFFLQPDKTQLLNNASDKSISFADRLYAYERFIQSVQQEVEIEKNKNNEAEAYPEGTIIKDGSSNERIGVKISETKNLIIRTLDFANSFDNRDFFTEAKKAVKELEVMLEALDALNELFRVDGPVYKVKEELLAAGQRIRIEAAQNDPESSKRAEALIVDIQNDWNSIQISMIEIRKRKTEIELNKEILVRRIDLQALELGAKSLKVLANSLKQIEKYLVDISKFAGN